MTSKTIIAALLTCVSMNAGNAAPFRAVVDAKSGYFLGASDGKKWLDAKAAAPLVKNQTYNLLNPRGKIGATTGGKPQSQGAPCEDTLYVDLKTKRGEIAVGGNGNFSPRAPQVLSNNSPVYRKIVGDILRKHGLKPVVKITKILRVDLEGDGTQEVLISATNHKGYVATNSISSRSLKNEYSILLMRKVVGGKVVTQMLSEEYFAKDLEFNAPSIYTIAGVWDLNGDGRLEIVTRGRYYEGDGTTVYAVRGSKATKVLEAGCGA